MSFKQGLTKAFQELTGLGETEKKPLTDGNIFQEGMSLEERNRETVNAIQSGQGNSAIDAWNKAQNKKSDADLTAKTEGARQSVYLQIVLQIQAANLVGALTAERDRLIEHLDEAKSFYDLFKDGEFDPENNPEHLSFLIQNGMSFEEFLGMSQQERDEWFQSIITETERTIKNLDGLIEELDASDFEIVDGKLANENLQTAYENLISKGRDIDINQISQEDLSLFRAELVEMASSNQVIVEISVENNQNAHSEYKDSDFDVGFS